MYTKKAAHDKKLNACYLTAGRVTYSNVKTLLKFKAE